MNGGEPRCFVDANVWPYAFIGEQDARKSAQARQLLRERDIVLSLQVVNEVCVNLVRKARYPEAKVRALIEAFYRRYTVLDLDRPLLPLASQLRERYGFAFWDGLVVARAVPPCSIPRTCRTG